MPTPRLALNVRSLFIELFLKLFLKLYLSAWRRLPLLS